MCKKFFYVCILLFAFGAWASDESELYNDAVEAAAHHEFDSAFAGLDSLITLYPESKLLDRALFSVGEYHYSCANYRASQKALRRLADNYPGAKAKLFALVYLLEIARHNGDDAAVKSVEREVVSFMKVSLLFRNSKTYRYVSPFKKKYKAVYFIDRIDFYIDEKPFTSVAY